jgi:hypothetical protein
MASAAAYTTPTAPNRAAAAHPRLMLSAAIASVHSACHRASFGRVSSTKAGRCMTCPTSTAPKANASHGDTSIRPPDGTVAAHGHGRAGGTRAQMVAEYARRLPAQILQSPLDVGVRTVGRAAGDRRVDDAADPLRSKPIEGLSRSSL